MGILSAKKINKAQNTAKSVEKSKYLINIAIGLVKYDREKSHHG